MKIKILLIMVFAFLLTACVQSNDNELGIIDQSTLSVNLFTSTAVNTKTNTPNPPTATAIQPSLSPTFTMTSSITPSPTSSAVFSEVTIIGGEYYGENSIIYIDIPGLDKVYGILINDLTYQCSIAEEIPNRLICYGKYLDNQKSKEADIKIMDEDTDELLFEKIVYVPMTIPTPLPIGEASTWCPLRGTNITCETEWRTENGEMCIVKSCFDACGYYYSEHTCNEDPHNNAIVEPTATPH